MTINIHGNEYVTVAERVKAIHEDVDHFSIKTEVLQHEPVVVVKATVSIPVYVGVDAGQVLFTKEYTGISAANPSKAIEKMSPYEVAETSAVGRALGFAGYGLVDGIATADEMVKATHGEESSTAGNVEASKPYVVTATYSPKAPTEKQILAIAKMASYRGEIGKELSAAQALMKEVAEWKSSTISDYIGGKIKLEEAREMEVK